KEQSREFVVCSELLSPIEIIGQATLVGAEIVREENRLGVFELGARAGVLVVDGDPVRDLAFLLDQGAHLSVIMHRGRFHKNLLSSVSGRAAGTGTTSWRRRTSIGWPAFPTGSSRSA